MAAPADGRLLKKAKVKRQKAKEMDESQRGFRLYLLPFAFLLLP
jgi:hypothetical protein